MVVEAMAAGVPVVAYDSGSLPEVVGSAGILVDEGDILGLRHAVEIASTMGVRERDQARQFARDHYSWDRIALQLGQFYERALSTN
jgi:glycosyltransferase involved in cell wall biosynthesis